MSTSATNALVLMEQKIIEAPIQNDFPAFGISFSNLSDDQVETIAVINEIRLGVLNRLSGNEDWDFPSADA